MVLASLPSRSPVIGRAIGITLAILGALPLLVCIPAPLQDWPNHLARVFVIDELLRGVGPWAPFYTVHSFLIPNVALDLGVLGFMRAGLSLGAAGVAFLLLTYALFVSGFVQISRSFGAATAASPMLGSILFYNTDLFWGLVNTVTALSLLMWTVALWMRQSRPLPRLGIAMLGVAATFACHLVPAVLLVGILGLLDLVALAQGWRTAVLRHATSLAAALTFAALLALSPTGEDNLGTIHYVGTSVWSFAVWKAAMVVKVLLGSGLWPDLVAAALMLAVGLGVLVAARIRLSLAGAVVLAAVALLPLLAPQRMGTGSLLDYRLAIVPFIVAAATIRPVWRWAAAPALLFAVIAGGLLVRTAAMGVAWHATDRVYAQADRAFATLPPGSLLLPVLGRAERAISWQELWGTPVGHIDTLAVPHRILTPSVFANPVQQPLALRPEFIPLAKLWTADSQAGLEEVPARAQCGSYPGVFLAAIYPAAFMAGPATRVVNDRLYIIDACAREALAGRAPADLQR